LTLETHSAAARSRK